MLKAKASWVSLEPSIEPRPAFDLKSRGLVAIARNGAVVRPDPTLTAWELRFETSKPASAVLATFSAFGSADAVRFSLRH
jgi:hypothetical protein